MFLSRLQLVYCGWYLHGCALCNWRWPGTSDERGLGEKYESRQFLKSHNTGLAVHSYYLNLYHIFLTNSSATTIFMRCLGKNSYFCQMLRARAMLNHLWGNGEQCCMPENSAVIQDHRNDQPIYEIWSIYSICNELENGKKHPYNIKNIHWGSLWQFGLVWVLFRYYVGFSCHWRHLWYCGRIGIP